LSFVHFLHGIEKVTMQPALPSVTPALEYMLWNVVGVRK